MTLRERFRAWLMRGAAMPSPAPVVAADERKPAPKVSLMAIAEARATGREAVTPWIVPQPFMATGGSAPANMAMDSWDNGLASMFAQQISGAFSEGLGFLGYPYLAELSQRPEYRRIATIYALEATRKWIEFSGDDEGKIDKLEKAMERYKVRDIFREAVEHDCFFGRSQIFLDMGDRPNDPELSKPLMLRKEKIGKGELRGLKVIEPLWSYPGLYEATNPLAPDFYRPKYWQIQTAQVHASRLLTIVGREMPDILKPAYAFGGLSMSQMAKPYVDNWLRARQSVSDLLHSFSTMVLSTDLSAVLSGLDAGGLIARADLFNVTRDNRGLMMLNKDTEELTNVSTPLGTLDKLQAQAQEQIASVTGIPLVILLGVTPSGLNASSDGEIKTFYATIKGYQEKTIREPLTTAIKAIMLSEFGEIDDSITFDFIDLWELDESAAAAVRKSDADADVAYINAGVVSPEETRERIANDEQSPYFGMDLSAPAPEPPGQETDEADAAALEGAQDAWEEGKHPRAENGQFGEGGGGSGGKEPAGKPDAPGGTPAPAGGAKEKEVHPRIRELLGEKGVERLRSLVNNKNSTAEQIAEALAPVEAAITNVTPTLAEGATPDAKFWASRSYTTDKSAPGTASASQARDHLVNVAKAYASDHGGVGVRYEAKARIMLGPPAAGKSTSAEEVARQGGYAIADSDDAKKVIPEFDDGVGASAVHEESGFLGTEALAKLLKEKANVILPVVGGSPGSIRKRIAALQAAGYSVTVDLVDVNPDEAARRRAGRTLSKGRHIASSYAMSIGDGPRRTYETLKQEYPDLGFGRIDGNGPPRSERYVEAVKHPDAKHGQSVFRSG